MQRTRKYVQNKRFSKSQVRVLGRISTVICSVSRPGGELPFDVGERR